MLKFIMDLFATPTPTPTRRTQLSLTAMEDRYAPTVLVNPFTLPSPQGIGTSPSVVRGFIIESGRSLVVQGGGFG